MQIPTAPLNRMHMLNWFVVLAVMVSVLATCGERSLPTASELRPPTMAISDAMHGDEAMRNPHFFFRGIWFGNWNVSNGAFDPTLDPVVEICGWDGVGEWTAENCAHVVTFATQGEGEQQVVVDAEAEVYKVRWHLLDYDLDSDLFYRIRVLVDGHVLGFADLDVWDRFRELFQIDLNEYIPLYEDRWNMWIKFRIEEGAVPQAPPVTLTWMNCMNGVQANSTSSVSETLGDVKLSVLPLLDIPVADAHLYSVSLEPCGTPLDEAKTLQELGLTQDGAWIFVCH